MSKSALMSMLLNPNHQPKVPTCPYMHNYTYIAPPKENDSPLFQQDFDFSHLFVGQKKHFNYTPPKKNGVLIYHELSKMENQETTIFSWKKGDFMGISSENIPGPRVAPPASSLAPIFIMAAIGLSDFSISWGRIVEV